MSARWIFAVWLATMAGCAFPRETKMEPVGPTQASPQADKQPARPHAAPPQASR